MLVVIRKFPRILLITNRAKDNDSGFICDFILSSASMTYAHCSLGLRSILSSVSYVLSRMSSNNLLSAVHAQGVYVKETFVGHCTLDWNIGVLSDVEQFVQPLKRRPKIPLTRSDRRRLSLLTYAVLRAIVLRDPVARYTNLSDVRSVLMNTCSYLGFMEQRLGDDDRAGDLSPHLCSVVLLQNLCAELSTASRRTKTKKNVC